MTSESWTVRGLNGDLVIELELQDYNIRVCEIMRRVRSASGDGKLCMLLKGECEMQPDKTLAQLGVQAGSGLTCVTMDLAHLIELGKSATELREIAYSAFELKAAGYTPQQLVVAYSAFELQAAGFTPQQLVEGNCTLQELRDSGYMVAEIWEIVGYQKSELWAILGYQKLRYLKDAGYTLSEIKEADLTLVRPLQPKITLCELVQSESYTWSELKKSDNKITDLYSVDLALWHLILN